MIILILCPLACETVLAEGKAIQHRYTAAETSTITTSAFSDNITESRFSYRTVFIYQIIKICFSI